MASEPSLEEAVHLIVAECRRLRAASLEQSALLAGQEEQIEKLETQNAELRASIDALNADRFSLKKLKDERKTVQRKVTAALSRLESLEKEVAIVHQG